MEKKFYLNKFCLKKFCRKKFPLKKDPNTGKVLKSKGFSPPDLKKFITD